MKQKLRGKKNNVKTFLLCNKVLTDAAAAASAAVKPYIKDAAALILTVVQAENEKKKII